MCGGRSRCAIPPPLPQTDHENLQAGELAHLGRPHPREMVPGVVEIPQTRHLAQQRVHSPVRLSLFMERTSSCARAASGQTARPGGSSADSWTSDATPLMCPLDYPRQGRLGVAQSRESYQNVTSEATLRTHPSPRCQAPTQRARRHHHLRCGPPCGTAPLPVHPPT